MSESSVDESWKNASRVFASLVLIVCYLIGLPLLIYCLHLFYSHRNKAYFVKRNTRLFWIFVSILSVYILLCAPLEALSSRGHLFYFLEYSPFATVMFQGTTVSAMLLSNISRFWYIFVQIRVSQERAEWKKILNPNHQSWVVKYSKYIVSSKYIISFNLIVLSLLIAIVCAVGDTKLAGRTLIAFIFICAFLQLMLFCFSSFVDYWYIRDEFKKYFYLLFIAFVAIALCVCWYNSPNIGYFNYIYITFIACCVIECYLFYATKCVILKNENRSIKLKNKNKKNKMQNTKKFEQFISAKEGYCELMQHITREFSTENLLFLTVLVHFQRFLLEFRYLNHFLLISNFDIPKDIPCPPIIQNQTDKLRKRMIEKDKDVSSAHSAEFSFTKKRNSSSMKRAMNQLFTISDKVTQFKRLGDLPQNHEEKDENSISHENQAPNLENESKTVDADDEPKELHNITNNSNNSNTINNNGSTHDEKGVSRSNSSYLRVSADTADESFGGGGSAGSGSGSISCVHEKQHTHGISAQHTPIPLPVREGDVEEDMYSHLDFSALIPIYDMMYKKYIIRNSAPMEINISYDCSVKLMALHSKMMSSHRRGLTVNDWRQLFYDLKDAGKQTLALLHDSYSRFKFQTNMIESNRNFSYLS